jgi:hypothetical protein
LNEPEDDNGYTAERKDNDDDIERLKKELVGDQAQDVLSNNDYSSLKDELDSKIPDRDYAEFVIRTIKRTVRQEDPLVRQIVYTAISKDSSNPINLAVIAPTSEGKTYPVLESLQYFPKRDIWKIGTMTPKVIIRQKGIPVDSNNQPIADRIIELKKEIKRAKKNSDKKEDLEQQLSQLYDEVKVLIDLRGQLLVFLEPPHRETWTILKPILSHDDYEIEYPYVYEDKGMGFKVKKVVIRGWPACIFCSAKNEADWPYWPEIQSRFLIASPNMVQQKYRDGNILIAQKMGLPSLLQQSIIVSNSQSDLAKKCVYYILNQVRQRSSNNTNPVWIPYAPILGQILPAEKGTDNRIMKRILSFLVIITLARAHLRSRLEYGNESLAITDIDEDLHEVLHITQNLTGIPPYKLGFFKETFLPLYKSKQEPDKSQDGTKHESIIALTTRELCDTYKERTGKTITTDSLKKTYLNEFISNGLIDETNSVVDARQKIYYALIDLPVTDQKASEKITKLSNLDRFDNILQHPLISVPKNSIKFPDNWLELQIFVLLECRVNISNFGLYNKQGGQVCICKFIKEYDKEYDKEYPESSGLIRYFSEPIFYNSRSKIFGSMRILSTSGVNECKKLSNPGVFDNLVISIGPMPIVQLLYSQTIQRKITPPPCNNVLTENYRIVNPTPKRITDREVDYNKNIEQTHPTLRDTPAALVLTNDDFEDVESDDDDSDNSGDGS